MKLNSGAKRHHYSMFNVGRSMFDVHPYKIPERGKYGLRVLTKQVSADGASSPICREPQGRAIGIFELVEANYHMFQTRRRKLM